MDVVNFNCSSKNLIHMKKLLILLMFVALVACHKGEEPDSPGMTFLNEILDVMQNHAIHKKDLDWQKIRDSATLLAQGVNSVDDLYAKLPAIIGLLHDHQSYIYHNNGFIYGQNNDHLSCPVNPIADPGTLDNIGYIRVDTKTGNDGGVAYATDMQTLIKQQDVAGLKGWIIDLRQTNSGYVYSMFSGLGPLLGEGVIAIWFGPDNDPTNISYKLGGTAVGNSDLIARVTSPYTLSTVDPKIAILISQGTISVGEYVAASFMGKTSTRTFGTSSCGLTTGTFGYKLSDGSTFVLTAAVIADRQQHQKFGPIVPDQTVAEGQDALEAAVEWLNQP
jgi:carboxyl-terminal processing protease